MTRQRTCHWLLPLVSALALVSCNRPVGETAKATGVASPVESSPFSLHVTFNGAIAFVPRQASDGSRLASVTALAVKADDLTKRAALLDGAKRAKFDVPLHYAYLSVKTRDYCVGKPATCAPSGQAGNADTLIPLGNDDVQIAELHGNGLLKDKSLDDIPHLSEISDHDKLCQHCLEASAANKRVAARLEFSTGSFKVIGGPNEYPKGNILEWKFQYLPDLEKKGTPLKDAPRANSTPRKLYGETMLSVESLAHDIVVTLRSFDGKLTRFLTLHPAAQDNGVMEIQLLDLPATTLLGRPRDYEIAANRIDHFVWFYNLTDGGDKNIFPIPVAINGRAGGDPFCDEAIINP